MTRISAALAAFDLHILETLASAWNDGGDWVALPLKCLVTHEISRDMARAICRSLRTRGYAEFKRGLWTEDGEPAGAGYTITKAGRKYLDELQAEALAEYRFDLTAHLVRQRAFSDRTFGPGLRTEGVADHILKELVEVSENPTDLGEWIDVVILGFDGATRCAQHLGLPMSRIVVGLVDKQKKNEGRRWPDWRTADPNKAIEHVRGNA